MVGLGFDWLSGHTQLALDLMRAGPEQFAPRDPQRMGATWLHGLGGWDQDLRIPLSRFNRATELASRVAALIPSETGNDPFKSFGQMALSNVVQGLLAVEERPSLVSLRHYLEGGAEALVERALRRHFTACRPDRETEAATLLACARDATARVKALVRYYRERISSDHPSTVLDGLLGLYEYEQVHFSKMVASLMPILNMLTSGDLEGLLSPVAGAADDPRRLTNMAEVIAADEVLYVGLDSLSDAMVGSAIGSILIADLDAVAGDRYNHQGRPRPVNVFIDESAEVVNDPFIQLLNKGRGAGLRLVIAAQTFADFAARTGSEAKARQVLGNINNLVALHVLDAETQEYVAESLPKPRVITIMRSHLNAALKRSQRDALTQVEIDWPDSRGLLERLALGLWAGYPTDEARSTRLQAIAVAAINAHKAAKKAGVPDRVRFTAFFEAIMGALAPSEHAVVVAVLFGLVLANSQKRL